jgi:acyl-coenzyme A synthetase/AMP-(fatty) acid ligase
MLRNTLATGSTPEGRMLWGAEAGVRLTDLAHGTSLGGRLAELAGRRVLVRASDQLTAAVALVELDGVAARMALCPPDLNEAHLASIIETAGIDAVVSDLADPLAGLSGLEVFSLALPLKPMDDRTAGGLATEWVMFTSGTTGVPKLVVHSLEGLTGAIRAAPAPALAPVWGTFYDIRRYGGLQILLRALLAGGSMILSDAHEAAADHLARLGRLGVTHLSGTPSHWRRALMTPAIAAIAPGYVRMSGEVVDQAVLDSLKAQFPSAAIGHAYASTEAGVGFEVNDGREGFPAALVEAGAGPSKAVRVEMRVVEGSLQLRSTRAASRYLNADAPRLVDADGFVDSGDMVERRGDRYHFVGRRGGIINVGGLKVHPEEVEAVINRHPAVRMSLVKGRRNPITGAIVVAEVVLNAPQAAAEIGQAALRESILAACRAELAPFKTPAMVKFVPALAVSASGKLERPLA